MGIAEENGDRVALLAKALKDGGVLNGPTHVKALAGQVEQLASKVVEQGQTIDDLEKQLKSLASQVEESDRHRKVLKRLTEALVPKRLRKIRAKKTEDGGWDLEVESE